MLPKPPLGTLDRDADKGIAGQLLYHGKAPGRQSDSKNRKDLEDLEDFQNSDLSQV